MGNKKGFTLIELLIVIAIIGILASAILVSLSNTRGNARNAQRKSDLSQISKALELYYSAYGYYPNHINSPALGNGWDVGYNYDNTARTEWAGLQTELNSYFSKLPTDPSLGDNVGVGGYMYYDRNVVDNGPVGQGFTLISYGPSEIYDPSNGCNSYWYRTHYPNKFFCIYK